MKYGNHTPSVTTKAIETLRELTNLKIEDNSRLAVICDMIDINPHEDENKPHVIVWMPNTDKPTSECDADEYNQFTVCIHKYGELGSEDDETHDFKTIEEVANFLNQREKRKTELIRECELLKARMQKVEEYPSEELNEHETLIFQELQKLVDVDEQELLKMTDIERAEFYIKLLNH